MLCQVVSFGVTLSRPMVSGPIQALVCGSCLARVLGPNVGFSLLDVVPEVSCSNVVSYIFNVMPPCCAQSVVLI